MLTQTQNVKGWLRSKKICVLDEWVQACVEWIQEQNEGDTMGSHQLCEMVYEQWLGSDLSEIATPCLPPNIKDARSTKLNGSFALQVNCIQDISIPAYGQLVKMQGRENENASVSAAPPTQTKYEPKPSRLLMMTLTDGQQLIQAMEYRPVGCLRIDLAPGTKILLSGDMRCRLGVILLTSAHVKVLGGEVEALMETNSQEKILARAIGVGLQEQQPGENNQGINQNAPATTPASAPPRTNQVAAISGSTRNQPPGNISSNITTENRTYQNTSQKIKPKQEVNQRHNSTTSWGQGSKATNVDALMDDDGIDDQMLEEIEMIERQQQKVKKEEMDWGGDDIDEEELLLAMEWDNSNQTSRKPHANGNQSGVSNSLHNQAKAARSVAKNNASDNQSIGISEEELMALEWEDSVHTSNKAHANSAQSWRQNQNFSSKPQSLSIPIASNTGLNAHGLNRNKNNSNFASKRPASNNQESISSNQASSSINLVNGTNNQCDDISEDDLLALEMEISAETSHKSGTCSSSLGTTGPNRVNQGREIQRASDVRTRNRIDDGIDEDDLLALEAEIMQESKRTNPTNYSRPKLDPTRANFPINNMATNVGNSRNKGEFTSNTSSTGGSIGGFSVGGRQQSSHSIANRNVRVEQEHKLSMNQTGITKAQSGIKTESSIDFKGVRSTFTNPLNIKSEQSKENGSHSNKMQANTSTDLTKTRVAIATRFIKEEPQSQKTSATSNIKDQWNDTSSAGNEAKRRKVDDASVLPCPFIYLIKIADKLERKEECQFDIKGFIMTLVSSLSHNPTWSLTAKINDGTMSLDVDISEEVLTELIGFTVKEMIKMKKDLKTSDTETATVIKNHIKNGISRCQRALMDFSCIMTLKMKPGYVRPKLVAFRHANMDDMNMLRAILDAD